MVKFAFTSVVVTGVCVCGLTPGPDISHLITGCFVRCIQSQLCLKYIRYKSCIPHLYTIFYSFIGKLCLRIDVPVTNSFEVALSSCSAANCIITKCKRIRKGFFKNIIFENVYASAVSFLCISSFIVALPYGGGIFLWNPVSCQFSIVIKLIDKT